MDVIAPVLQLADLASTQNRELPTIDCTSPQVDAERIASSSSAFLLGVNYSLLAD